MACARATTNSDESREPETGELGAGELGTGDRDKLCILGSSHPVPSTNGVGGQFSADTREYPHWSGWGTGGAALG